MAEGTQNHEAAACVVVVEPGAAWPVSVFHRIAGRDGVAVVARLPGEGRLRFLTRLARAFELLERDGLPIRHLVMACSGNPTAEPSDRRSVLETLARRMAEGQACDVVLVGDGSEGTTASDLVPLAEGLFEVAGHGSVSVDVLSGNRTSAPVGMASAVRVNDRCNRPSPSSAVAARC